MKLVPQQDVVYAGCLACWLEKRGAYTGKVHNGLGENCPADWPDALPDPDGSNPGVPIPDGPWFK